MLSRGERTEPCGLTNIKVGDVLEIVMGPRPVKVRVLVVSEHATKADAAQMYEAVS